MNNSLRQLDLNLLPLFCALMEEQHLTRASERLHMSQPALSSALKRLRERFDDELFIRSAQGLTPTTRAHQLYGKVRDGLQLIDQGVSRQPSFDASTSQQHFTLCANAAVEYLTAGRFAAYLRQQAPNITLTFEPDHLPDIAQRLQNGRLDLAIDFVSYPAPGLEAQALRSEDLVVIANQHHQQFTRALSVSDFEQLPQVTVTPRNQQGTPLEQLLGHKNIRRRVCLHVSSFLAVMDVVANSDLIAIVPSTLARQWSLSHPQQKLQTSPLPFDCPAVPLQLIWHKSRSQDQPHLWLRQQLLQLAQLV